MTLLITKYAVTAFIIVLASEVAKRSDKLGALITSLPLVTFMVMIWLFVEKQPSEKIANHAYYTFWFVIPTLPMFLLLYYMLKRGFNFYISLSSGTVLTLFCFIIAAWVAKRFDINLF